MRFFVTLLLLETAVQLILFSFQRSIFHPPSEVCNPQRDGQDNLFPNPCQVKLSVGVINSRLEAFPLNTISVVQRRAPYTLVPHLCQELSVTFQQKIFFFFRELFPVRSEARSPSVAKEALYTPAPFFCQALSRKDSTKTFFYR